jgi:ribosomal protein S18 acetylase RimI-like enzyme
MPDPPLDPVDLPESERERAVPVLLDSFTGIYRWHAKRTLREVGRVRAIQDGGRVVAITMLEVLVPAVGYVYYVAVAASHRGRGLSSRLLDDALAIFRAGGQSVVYVATEPENRPMVAGLERRGFRTVERKEPGYAEGGLGAWGLRSRMTLVSGEVLYGLRVRAWAGTTPTAGA